MWVLAKTGGKLEGLSLVYLDLLKKEFFFLGICLGFVVFGIYFFLWIA